MFVSFIMLALFGAACFATGWFGRIYMEKHRAAQTAQIDDMAGKAGDQANALIAEAKARIDKP